MQEEKNNHNKEKEGCPLCYISEETIKNLKKETANLKCTFCGHIQRVEIPEDKCLSFYKCQKCEKNINLPEGSKDCCIICAYSDKKCPMSKDKTD